MNHPTADTGTRKIARLPRIVFPVFHQSSDHEPGTESPSDMIYTYDNYSYLKPDNYRTSNELPSDQTTQFEPWKFFARDQLRQGIVPWVNPYQAQGVPFIGNDQSAVFFPTNILFYCLPVNFATTLGAILRLTCAAFGMYLFLTFKIDRWISFIGGGMFAFSGFNIVWLLHPLTNVSIFLPWLFWFTYKLTTPDLAPDQRLKLHLGLSLVVFLQFLGGHVETSFHICFATACYVMYRLASSTKGTKDIRHKRSIWMKTLVNYSIPVIAGTLLASIELVPFALYLRDSYALSTRGGDNKNAFGAPAEAALAWVVPNIYGNPRDNVSTPEPTISISIRTG